MALHTVPRAVLLLVRHNALDTLDAMGAALQAMAPSVAERFAPASLRMGLCRPDNPLAAQLADRGLNPVDAIIEITWPEPAGEDEILRTFDGLADLFDGVADTATSTVLIGDAHLVVVGDAPVLLGVGGRRDKAIGVDAFRNWHLHQHAKLIQEIADPMPSGYEQLHADRGLSKLAAERAGFAYEPYDMFVSINVEDLGAFMNNLTDPAIAGRLYEDELGHVDHSASRGAACDVIWRSMTK